MDCGGVKLTLHVGAMHEAVMLAPPAPGLVTPPAVLTEATAVLDEAQVNVGLMALPAMSYTEGATLELVPFVPVIVLPPVPLTANEIACTGQVRNESGALVVSAIDAVICVKPGVCAVTCAWPLGIPFVFNAVNVATVG
jgi:hypothetical protein